MTEPNLILKLRKDWRYPAALAALILTLAVAFGIVALLYALHSSNSKLDHQDEAAVCRSRAAVALATADGDRTDALADGIELILRLFDASYKRDTATVDAEAARLPELYGRLRQTSEAIETARVARAVSIDACTTEPKVIPEAPTTR